MKDIHEVQHTFNHVHWRGVVAKAGSVHLIYSMDQKLGLRGGSGHTHSSAILRILQEIWTDLQKHTASPQTIPLTQLNNNDINAIRHHTPPQ